MHFTVEVSDLAKAAQRCAVVADTKSTAPICRTVRLTAQGGDLAVTAVNILTGTRLTISIEADVFTEGATCIDAALLQSWAAAMPSGAQAVFELTENARHVVARSGRSKTNLKFMHPATFPGLTENQPELTMVDGPALAMAVKSALTAAARNDSRDYLNGCGFSNGYVVGTDAAFLVAAPLPGDFTGILHRTAAPHISHAVGDSEQVEFGANGNAFLMRSDSAELYQRGMSEDYPDWARLIEDGHKLAEFSRDEMAEAITTASLGQDTEARLAFEKSQIHITCGHRRTGQQTKDMKVAPVLDLGDSSTSVDADVFIEGELAVRTGQIKAALNLMPVGLVEWAVSDQNLSSAPKSFLRPVQRSMDGSPVALLSGIRI